MGEPPPRPPDGEMGEAAREASPVVVAPVAAVEEVAVAPLEVLAIIPARGGREEPGAALPRAPPLSGTCMAAPPPSGAPTAAPPPSSACTAAPPPSSAPTPAPSPSAARTPAPPQSSATVPPSSSAGMAAPPSSSASIDDEWLNEHALVLAPLAHLPPLTPPETVQSYVPEYEPECEINWTELELEKKWEEEGGQDVTAENAVYEAIGLAREDELEEQRRKAACSNLRSSRSSDVDPPIDYASAGTRTTDDVPGEGRIFYDLNNPVMDPGNLYKTMESFRLSIRQYAMDKEFDLGTEHTNQYRFRGFCRGGDVSCPWCIHARQEKKGSTTIVVVVLNDVHTCHSSSRRRTTAPTNNWVAARALPILMDEPNLGCKKLRERLMTKYGVKLSYDKVWHGKEKALKELFGTWEESFKQLWSFKEAVLKADPDSVVEISTRPSKDGQPLFDGFFSALGPCISGFKRGCRPYLAIDATALNGRWNGNLAAAVAVDGQHWMYPVAYGFFQGEGGDNWTWWFQQLHKVVGDLPILALCSDAGKGLRKAMDEVFPNAERRECFRHLMQNYEKNHHPGAECMYPASRAYRKDAYEQYFANVQAHPKVMAWMNEHHKGIWWRSGFNPAIKVDYITSNIAESFNKWVKEWKDLPPCDLAEC